MYEMPEEFGKTYTHYNTSIHAGYSLCINLRWRGLSMQCAVSTVVTLLSQCEEVSSTIL